MRANGNTNVTLWIGGHEKHGTLEELIDKMGSRLSALSVLHMVEALNQKGMWQYDDIRVRVKNWDDGSGVSTDDPSMWQNGLDLDRVTENTGLWFVAVFLVDREYGGPEEGGWYYEAGVPVLEDGIPTPMWTADEAAALQHREVVQRTLDETVNKGRRSIGSVLSQGEYRAVMDQGWPRPFPETRPRYE